MPKSPSPKKQEAVRFRHCGGCGCVVSDWKAHKKFHADITLLVSQLQKQFQAHHDAIVELAQLVGFEVPNA